MSVNIILYLLLGVTAGAVGGALGVGGGIIMVPAMVLFFGLTPHALGGARHAFDPTGSPHIR